MRSRAGSPSRAVGGGPTRGGVRVTGGCSGWPVRRTGAGSPEQNRAGLLVRGAGGVAGVWRASPAKGKKRDGCGF